MVPALAKTCTHVVMVQRSPSYVIALPRYFSPVLSLVFDALAWVKFGLGVRLAQALLRWGQKWLDWFLYTFCIACPSFARRIFWWLAAPRLGDKAEQLRPHLTPSYDPWRQRVSADADGEFFKALRDGKASIVTSALSAFTCSGVRLANGTEVDCDVVVTALGLKLVGMTGKVDISVDGMPIKVSQQMSYRGVMISDVPNYVHILGYINNSWTLRAELVWQWLCALLNHLQTTGHCAVVPEVPPHLRHAKRRPFAEGFNPNYITRDYQVIAQQLEDDPWRIHNLDYIQDVRALRASFSDSALRFF